MYYYPGHRIQKQFCTQSALTPLPGEHSGQSPFYKRAQCQLNHNIIHILPGPHLRPGSRAAMWIKCLAEGQKYRVTVGFEPGLSTRESSGHTTIPGHLHSSRRSLHSSLPRNRNNHTPNVDSAGTITLTMVNALPKESNVPHAKRLNHFASVCRSSKPKYQQSVKAINADDNQIDEVPSGHLTD